MTPDPLSEVLALVDARCVISGGIRARGAWALRFRPDVVKLEAVAEGACWLVVDGAEPVRLRTGDVVVLHDVEDVLLCSDPRVPPVAASTLDPRADGDVVTLGDGVGEPVTLVAGHVAVDAGASGLLASALPPVLHADAATGEAAEMRRLLDLVVAERTSGRPGARFAADQHAQLVLLEALRLGMQGDERAQPGWLRLVTDPALRPAVELLHGEPGRDWAVQELADAVGMSRSHFAHRFRAVAGQPPLTYLTHWRVRLAERALRRSSTTVAELADRLGYATESSFSHAFTRVAGMPPSRYRTLAQGSDTPEHSHGVAAAAD